MNVIGDDGVKSIILFMLQIKSVHLNKFLEEFLGSRRILEKSVEYLVLSFHIGKRW